MIAGSQDRRFDSLSHSITQSENPDLKRFGILFGKAAESTPNLTYMAILREIFPLNRRGAKVEIYLSMKDDPDASFAEVMDAYQDLAFSSRPDRLAIHVVSHSHTSPADLRKQLLDPQQNPKATMAWEGSLES